MTDGRSRSSQHSHDQADAVDWFAALDIVVWAAALIIVGLALEWMTGYLVREKISSGATRYLAKVRAGKAPAEPDAAS